MKRPAARIRRKSRTKERNDVRDSLSFLSTRVDLPLSVGRPSTHLHIDKDTLANKVGNLRQSRLAGQNSNTGYQNAGTPLTLLLPSVRSEIQSRAGCRYLVLVCGS